MKTQLLCVLFAGYFLCLVNRVTAQETSDNLTYYYNNFETASANNITSLGASGVGNATRTSSSITIDASTTSPLNGSVSLRSAVPATNAISAIRWDFVGSGTSGSIDMTQNDFEWNFIYKNNSATGPDDPDAMAVGNNSWRYWLIANGYTTNTMQGIYITHTGTTLSLRYRYDSNTGNGRYNELLNATMANDQQTYMIKVQRLKDGRWAIFKDVFVAGMTTAKTLVASSNGTTGSGFSTYYYSYLESTCTTAGRFQWDNFDMYTRVLQFTTTGANGTANNVTQPPYYESESVILYGLKIISRGNFTINQLVIATTGAGFEAYFNGSGSLYRSDDSYYSTSADALICSMNYTGNAMQSYSVGDLITSSGNTDGSYSVPGYYFWTGTVKSQLNYGGSPTGTITPTSISTLMGNGNSTAITYTGPSSSGNTITFVNAIDWTGASDNNWNNTGNWSPATVPTTSNVARIGVVSFKNQPIVQSTVPNVASLILGPTKSTLTGTPSLILTINTTYSLTVNGAITQNHNSSAGGVTTTITGTGTGTLNCNSFVLGDNTTPPAPTALTTPTSNTTIINATVPVFNITNSLTLNTTSSALGTYALIFLQNYSVNNATFHLNSGTLTVSNISTTNSNYVNRNDGLNTITNAALVDMDTGTGATTLNLTGNTPISAATGGTIDFTTGGSGTGLVNYSATSGTQTVYATSDSFISSSPSNYDNLTLSGAAAKTVDGGALTVSGNWITSGGAINLNTNDPNIAVTGNWTNSANVTQDAGSIAITGNTTNSSVITGASGTLTFTGTYGNSSGSSITTGSGTATFTGAYTNTAGTFTCGSGSVIYNSDYTNTGTFTPGTGTVFFSKAGAQSLTDNSTNGTKFNNVTVNGSGTKTMSGTGKFAVSSSGILTMGGTATLAAGGVLTLNSDATGSATVASIPSGTAITGNVNVQRYINGGASKYRGYRLLTSSVNTGTSSPVFTLAYLKNNAFVTGTTLAAGGFDVSPGANNPSIYFFKESQAANQSSFTSGYFRGVNSLTSPYSFDGETGTRSIGAGNGFIFFFRGDRTLAGSISTAVVSTYVPQPTTMTETGTLNQGNITVANWYNGASTLQYSSPAVNTLQGYNLVGNPYASTINFEKFNRKGTSGSNANAASSIYISGQKAQIYTTTAANVPPLAFIWVYNLTTKNYESYQQNAGQITSVNDTTTTVNPGIQSVVGGAASNMIASGQGFFVIANGSGQALTFRESAKVTTQPLSTSLTGVFSLPQDKTPIAQTLGTGNKALMSAANTPIAATSVSEPVSQPSPVMHLLLEKDEANFDGVALVFDKWATANFDKNKDAEDLGGNGALESFSALTSDGVKTSIHHRPLPGKTQATIPLFADATTSGPYKIKLTDVKDLPAIYEVWLKDNFTKDSVDLKHNNAYSYNIDKSIAATFGKDRFQLIMRQNPALGLKLIDFNAVKVSDGAKTTWVVENEANYSSFNLQRSVDNGKTWEDLNVMQSNGLGTYSYTDPNPAKGLNKYRVQLTDLNNDISLSKELPLMYANTQNNISNSLLTIYPNPVHETVNLTISQTNSSANYNIQLTNSSGVLLKTVNITQLYWKNNVAGFVPGTYIIRVTDNKTRQLIGTGKFVKL
ncbi:T9SS type A sorting domain-containing protein [Mucilaginibacter sp. Mucisp86]|uniref:T9SS type A sorting domain-containing protein n=1 Tax=Mucilaginibacter sp. Mucisp86 TaxID=3243060 RepID=UPI0039B3B0DC